MRRLSTAFAALGLVAGVAGGSPASAGAGAFTGTVQIRCFGCGTGAATGEFVLDPGGPFRAVFEVDDRVGACLASGYGEGEFTGAVTGYFTWQRAGAAVHLTTNGLPGSATFVVTSPAGGNPCGGPATATVSGTIAF